MWKGAIFQGYTPRQSDYGQLMTAGRRISFSRDEPPYESSKAMLSALIPYIQTTKTSTYFSVCAYTYIHVCMHNNKRGYQLEGGCGKGWRKEKEEKGGKVMIIF